MDQNGSFKNPENGLNLQLKPNEFAAAVSSDEEFDKIVEKLLVCAMKKSKKQKIKFLEKWFSRLTKINLAKVMDLFPEENHYVIPYLLQSIASRAKNMSDLQIMDESVTKQQFTLMSMSEEMVSAIAKMTKLKTLRVRHFSISFSSLMELCRMLPSLKTLYFKIEAEPNFKIDDIQVFQKSFGSLEIFQFSPVSNESKLDEDFRKSLTLQCICYLTNLRIVGDPESVVDMLPTCLEINQLTEDEWKSKLTHLTLYLDKHVEENALTKFPDVMLMDIWEDKTNADYMVSGLLQFQHLTQLFMSDLDIYKSDCIVQFLEVYGESLTQLILQFKLCPIDFVLLFNMICCSSFDSLELLAMRNLDVQPPCDAYPQIGEISCKSLNELDLEFTIEQSYYPTHVHLSKILSVPTLERVKLTRVPTTLFELWETMVSVIKRTILKKVTRFELELSNEQMIEREIDARIKCCETIEEELLSKEVEVFVVVKQLSNPCEPQP